MATETMEAPVTEPKIVGINPMAEKFSERVLRNLKESEQAQSKSPEKTEPDQTLESAKKEPESATEVKESVSENPLLKAFTGKKTEEVKAPEVDAGVESKEPISNDKETNLGNLRKKVQAIEKERDEWKTKAEKPEPPSDYAKLKEEHALMQSALKKYSLAETPDFKNKYDAKLEGSKKTLQHVLSKTDVSPAEFIALVESPDSKERRQKISEITSEMDDLSKNLVHSQIASYDAVRMERETELSQPDQSLIQITERQKHEQEQRRIQHESVIDNVWAMAEKDLPWLAISADTSEEMKQEITAMRELANEVWKKPVGPEKQAALVLAGAMKPFYDKLISAFQSEVQKLNADLAKARSGTPSASAGRSSTTKESAAGKGSFVQRITEELEKNTK